jgi:branched-chain amino acid transport system permease protein
MWFVLPIAVVVAATFGVLLGAPTLKLRGDYLAIVTLGFGEIVRIFMNNLDRPVNITNGPKGITAVDPVHIFGFDFSKSHEIFGLKFTPVFMYYYLLVALVISSCSSACACRTRVSAAPGWPSAKTRSPPRRWASTPAT